MQQSRLDRLAWLIAGVGVAMFILALVVTSRVLAAAPEGNQNDGIEKVSDNAYEVDHALLANRLEETLPSCNWVVPRYIGDRYAGFKLVGYRSGLYHALGFEPGDVIVAVNSVGIDSPNQALALFEAFGDGTNIAVEIERKGARRILEYRLD